MPAEFHYEPATDLDKTLEERLHDFPRPPHMWMHALRTLWAVMLRSWLAIIHRFSVIGRDNLPRDGSFVLVANHSSHWDALCLSSILPLRRLHRTFPAAAVDYFFCDFPRSAIAATFINALPFDRKAHPRESIDLCRALLAKPGNVLIIFPEGTRSSTGELGPFKPGIGHLVSGTPVPVIPCLISGAHTSWPRGRFLPFPSPIRITIGSPVDFSVLAPGRDSAHHIAEDLHSRIEQLSRSRKS